MRGDIIPSEKPSAEVPPGICDGIGWMGAYLRRLALTGCASALAAGRPAAGAASRTKAARRALTRCSPGSCLSIFAVLPALLRHGLASYRLN